MRVKNAEDVTITGGGSITEAVSGMYMNQESFQHLFHLRQAVCQDVIRQKKLILFLEHSAIIIDREYVIQKINMVRANQNLKRPAALVWVQDSKNVMLEQYYLI